MPSAYITAGGVVVHIVGEEGESAEDVVNLAFRLFYSVFELVEQGMADEEVKRNEVV